MRWVNKKQSKNAVAANEFETFQIEPFKCATHQLSAYYLSNEKPTSRISLFFVANQGERVCVCMMITLNIPWKLFLTNKCADLIFLICCFEFNFLNPMQVWET